MRKQIVVYDARKDDPDTQMPANCMAFIAWCGEKLNEVPVEYRDSAEVEISADDDGWNFQILYWRATTRGEEEKAKAAALERVEGDIRFYEARVEDMRKRAESLRATQHVDAQR